MMAGRLLLLAHGAAAAAAGLQCPSAENGVCVAAPAHASYAGSSGLLTAAQCCAECVEDGELCFGYIFKGHGGGPEGKGSCSLFDTVFDTSSKHPNVNCTVGIFNSKPKPPPKPAKAAPKGAKNVLFIVADDMRPSMGPYAIEGQPNPFHTPALDKLAATGILFTRAYIQISYCAPSRNSFSESLHITPWVEFVSCCQLLCECVSIADLLVALSERPAPRCDQHLLLHRHIPHALHTLRRPGTTNSYMHRLIVCHPATTRA